MNIDNKPQPAAAADSTTARAAGIRTQAAMQTTLCPYPAGHLLQVNVPNHVIALKQKAPPPHLYTAAVHAQRHSTAAGTA
jgi:hypothetical protein